MTERTLQELTALTARVSDLYAARCGIERDELWYLAKLTEEVGELNAAYLSATGRGRARGLDAQGLDAAVSDELADVLAMVLLFARAQNIDLDAAVQRKWGKYLEEGPL